MASEVVHEFFKLLSRAFSRNVLSICLACSFVVALIGPFGTYGHANAIVRVLVWTVVNFSVTVLVYAVHSMLLVLLREENTLRFRLIFFVSSTMLGATLLRFLFGGVFPGLTEEIASWGWMNMYMGAVIGTIMAVRPFIIKTIIDTDQATDRGDAEASASDARSGQFRTRLAERLNIPQGTRIAKVSANGHFIEVKTCSEVFRIRMRFADAVAELDGLDGVLTHRSHWVALPSIRGWIPGRSKPMVVMQDGTQVPVSRSCRPAVEALALLVIEAGPESA